MFQWARLVQMFLAREAGLGVNIKFTAATPAARRQGSGVAVPARPRCFNVEQAQAAACILPVPLSAEAFKLGLPVRRLTTAAGAGRVSSLTPRRASRRTTRIRIA